MKLLTKSALALAIGATTSVPTFAAMGDAPDVTGVSGRFRVAVICDDDSCSQKDFGGRFRMAAEEDLGNGSTVFGKYEFEVDASEGLLKSDTARRLAYVGVKGGFGSISLGTRWSPYYNIVVSPVDWTRAFGGTWRTGAGYSSNFRMTNGLFYSVGGLQAMIQMAEDDSNEDVDQIEVGYSMALGPATVGIAVNDSETAEDANVGISAAGNAGSVRLALSVYSQGDDGGLMGQVRAPMAGGTASLSFAQDMRDDGPEASMIALEYDRPLGANSSWFIGAESNDDDNGTESDVFGVGLHYNFN